MEINRISRATKTSFFFRFEIRFFIEQSHHFLYLVTFFYCFIVVCVRQFRIHKHICSMSWLFRWLFFWICFVLSIVSMPCIIISYSPSALLYSIPCAHRILLTLKCIPVRHVFLSLSIFLSLFFFSCCANLSFMFGFWLFSWTIFDDFYRFFFVPLFICFVEFLTF